MPEKNIFDNTDVNDIPSLFELKKESDTAMREVPRAVVRRLPRYYRFLRQLLNQDVLRISSSELSEMMGLTSSQVRQDLNYFGDMGRQGYGYNVKTLYMKMSRVLCVDKKYSAVIIGAKLGKFFESSMMLEMRGIRLKAVFDTNRELIGQKAYGISVKPICEFEEYCKENQIDIAIIAVFDGDVQEIAKTAEKCGVKGIWNFSMTEIEQTKNLSVQNTQVGDSLMMLMYDINIGKKEK